MKCQHRLKAEYVGAHKVTYKGRRHRTQQHAGAEVAVQLFKREDNTGDWRIKSGSQARRGAACYQEILLALRPVQQLRDSRANRAAHLYRGSLAPQRQATAQAKKSAQELQRQHALPALVQPAGKLRRYLRDARA